MSELEFGKFDDFEYITRIPTNKLVEGMGVNDAPFVVKPTIKGIQIKHPAYSVWGNMLQRCYNIKYKDKHPTYLNITCCQEWLLFTNFAKWFKDNYIEDCQLDKDLLVKDNLIYSPNTCLFISKELNLFLTLRDKCRGSLPIGVSKSGSKYGSRIKDGCGHTMYIGSFNTPEQAHQAWQKAKLEQAIAFNFPPLQRVIEQLKFEIENNLETTSL